MSVPVRIPFPHAPEDFDNDERVSFSKLDKKWILEDNLDGSEWEFSEALGKWIPSLDEALVEEQAKAYAVPGVNEEEDATEELKKRKKQAKEETSVTGTSKRQKRSDAQKELKNTAIWVTNLPTDTNTEEVLSVFSKCGVIAENIDSGQPRIKLYTDDAGVLKGDALIVYFRGESVQLAIQMLDDTDFRFGETRPEGRMRVTEADFSYKKEKQAPTERKPQDKTKITKKTQKMISKLTDWSDSDSEQATKPRSSKHDKIVILSHMFTLQELNDDPAAILDIKQDIRDECAKLGPVTNVVLFDKEADGIASVRFATPEAALACVEVMDGRHFGGLKVEARIASGKEKYKKSDVKGETAAGFFEEDEDGEGEEKKRLDEFGAWLESEEQHKKTSKEGQSATGVSEGTRGGGE